MKQTLILASFLIPSILFAETPNKQIRTFRDSYEGYRFSQDRFERLLMGCLQSFDHREKNYNHIQIENLAFECAERLDKKLDERDYGKQE